MTVGMPTSVDGLLSVRHVCFRNLHAMAALQDAIAQIDALISRLQTEPLANGAPATHASASWPMPPVLATLSTAEQPRSSAAAAVDTASAGTAVPQATLPHAAASADASSHPDAGSGHQVGQQPAGGAASAAGDSQPAQDGRASAKKVKPAKAPKAPPPEPTPADMFARAHIQVREASLAGRNQRWLRWRAVVRVRSVLIA